MIGIEKKKGFNKKITKKIKISKINIKKSGYSISSKLVLSLINNIIESNIEKESVEDELENTQKEESENKHNLNVNKGYGTANYTGGMSSNTKYVNYDKIWENIGTFKSKSMYEGPLDVFSNSKIQSSGILLDNHVVEKAEKHFKYFVAGEVIGDVGYVPPVGANINSSDWEKYRIMTMMSIYKPLLALFRAII